MPLKITQVQSGSDGRTVLVYVGKNARGQWHRVETGFTGDPDSPMPLRLLPQRDPGHVGVWDDYLTRYWICRGRVFLVEGAGLVDFEELLVRIQHTALKEEKAYKRIQRELQALENLPFAEAARRERIPEDVRIFVWQRDQGRCVQCGSNQNLEFDQIIPFVKGGSSTSRNIQLLCEKCNRRRGKIV